MSLIFLIFDIITNTLIRTIRIAWVVGAAHAVQEGAEIELIHIGVRIHIRLFASAGVMIAASGIAHLKNAEILLIHVAVMIEISDDRQGATCLVHSHSRKGIGAQIAGITGPVVIAVGLVCVGEVRAVVVDIEDAVTVVVAGQTESAAVAQGIHMTVVSGEE